MRAQTIADYFILKSRHADDAAKPEMKKMSPLKLQKILYYAQGWYLGIHGKPLFNDPILAWKYGPVTKTVYDNLKHFGSQDLTEADWNCSGVKIIDPDLQAFLDYTWEQYAVETANELVSRTHSSEPWLTAHANPFSKQITPSSMQGYFQRMV